MGFIDVIKEKAKADKKTIVLPETEDKRTYEAAEAVLKEGTANLVLVGSKEEIEKTERDLISAEQRLLIRQHMKKQKHILQNW